MKKKHILSLLATLFSLTACISPFEADLDENEAKRLVVEGHIYLNQESVFTIYESKSLKQSLYNGMNSLTESYKPNYITTAIVAVRSSDGKTIYGHLDTHTRTYIVDTNNLDPTLSYYLDIHYNGEQFLSTPMKPLFANSINITYEQQTEEVNKVSILVSMDNPDPEQEMYLRFRYDETWEIYTPINSNAYYDPVIDKIVVYDNRIPALRRDHGWCTNTATSPIVLSTETLESKALKKYSIYNIRPTDDRLQTCYRTTVYAEAISREEYEYEQIKERQSNHMGGLFSPLPSELPCNIHSTNGSTKVIGFVGVRGFVAKNQLYIPSYCVQYESQHKSCDRLERDFVEARSNHLLWEMGYQICYYGVIDPIQSVSMAEWCPAWGVDCTHEKWGASREQPYDWCPPTNNMYSDDDF